MKYFIKLFWEIFKWFDHVNLIGWAVTKISVLDRSYQPASAEADLGTNPLNGQILINYDTHFQMELTLITHNQSRKLAIIFKLAGVISNSSHHEFIKSVKCYGFY